MDDSNEETFFPKVLLNRIYGNPKYEDVFFQFEGSVVKANKLVLSMVCENFAKIFHNTSERTTVACNGGELKKKCLRLVLEFIHRGFVNMDELRDDEVIALHNTSQELDFNELTDVVLHELKNIEVTLENVGKMYEVSKKSNLDWLQSKCLSFVDMNSEIVVVSHEFASFPEELVLEIVKSDTFYVKSELQLFHAVHSWAQNHKDKVITNILNYIRLNQISPKDFAMHVIKTGLISHEAFFEASIDEDMKPRIKVEQCPIITPRQVAMRGPVNSMNAGSGLATDAMSKLLLEDRLSDIILEFEDGSSMSGYAVFLSAACPKFVDFPIKVVKPVMFDEKVDLFKMVIDFIYGKQISFEKLSSDDLIGLFRLTQKIQFTPMIEEVSKCFAEIVITMENLGKLFTVASENEQLASLVDRCNQFADRCDKQLIAEKELFAHLPKAIVERIVANNLNETVFEALAEWKIRNESIDLSSILDALPLETISPEYYFNNIRRFNLITDDQYFQAHATKRPASVNVINASCNHHSLEPCNLIVHRIFSRVSPGNICNELALNADIFHKFSKEGESLFIETEHSCVINKISFRLRDDFLRLYPCDVKVGVRRDLMETVRPHFPGRYYASKQEIFFQPKPVKFIQITSIENEPVVLNLKSIEGSFDSGFQNECRQKESLIVQLPISSDDCTTSTYKIFDCNADEVVYMLRYASKVSTIGIQLSGNLDTQLQLFTKEQMNSEWDQKAIVNPCKLQSNSVIIFKESFVSFIKLKAGQIENKIKLIECPATAANFRL